MPQTRTPPRRLLALAASAALLAPAGAVRAEDLMSLEAHADMQNLVLLRNDTDFDRTAPFYDTTGQSEGVLATIFRPDVTWRIGKNLRIFYQAEIGLNYWNRQDPNEQDYSSNSVFVMRHRQVYGEGELGDFGFRAGYSEFTDATGLFLHHWIGVAQARYHVADSGQLELFFGEVPNQPYEGVSIDLQNGNQQSTFTRDIMVWGGTFRYAFSEELKLTFSVSNLFDSHVVGQVRRVYCPNLEVELRHGALSGFVDAALQAGRFTGTALDGSSQDLLAWALQGRAQVDFERVQLQLNGLALSPDGDYDGGSVSHAFLYSGKSKSATLVFTEDEIRNWYDGLDLRMATFRDGFYMNRAGLFVGDLKATFNATEAFKPAVILGVASTLNPHNSLGESFVGVEADLLLQYKFSEHFYAQLMFGAVFPGKAGAALINQIDLAQAEPIVSGEGSLLIHY